MASRFLQPPQLLEVDYHRHLRPTYVRPTGSSDMSSSVSLSIRSSVSSTGTAPGLTSSSDSDPSDLSPPESPTMTIDPTRIVRPSSISSSPIRPGLRHMPSWRSFISSSRSIRSSTANKMMGLESDAEDDNDDEVFADAIDETHLVVEKSQREREASVKSSHKGRSPLTFFKRSTVKERPVIRRVGVPFAYPSTWNHGNQELKLDFSDLAPSFPVHSTDSPSKDFYSQVRANTPLHAHDNGGTPIGLETMLELSPLSSPTTPEADEAFFTPRPIPSALLPSLAKMMKTLHPKHHPPAAPAPTPEAIEDAIIDPTLTFDLDIFSPRAPSAPVLRGIMDNLPISPLELPAPGPGIPNIFMAQEYPTPILPRDPLTSPIEPCREVMGIEQVLAQPRISLGCVGTTIGEMADTALQVHLTPRRHSVMPSTSTSSPKPSTITSSNSPTPPRRQALGNSTHPRRLSAIIRPPILPTPTPPSLLAPPRTLAQPVMPPLFSPPTPIGRSTIGSGFGSMKNRRTNRMLGMTSPSGSAPNLGGLGFGSIGTELDKEAEKVEHVDTPGTFGLEGEAERRLASSVNPYFAEL